MPTATAMLRTGVALVPVLTLFSIGACRSSVRATGSRPSASIEGTVPAAAFFRQPLLSHVTLSPDGEQIAAILARDGRETLLVRPTAGGEVRPLAKLERSRNRMSWTVRRVGWGSNERLLVGVEMPSAASSYTHRATLRHRSTTCSIATRSRSPSCSPPTQSCKSSNSAPCGQSATGHAMA